jgi:hypothetical protein
MNKLPDRGSLIPVEIAGDALIKQSLHPGRKPGRYLDASLGRIIRHTQHTGPLEALERCHKGPCLANRSVRFFPIDSFQSLG